ncbi:MAG: choice-of-anchor tandem repeat GloVer-containing protein [Terriglobales bacterium]
MRNFASSTTDGWSPSSNLISDGVGNLYGVTLFGGTFNEGSVYELSPNSDGSWSEAVLYSFCTDYPNCTDGRGPVGGLVFDSLGNLYGTTFQGGNSCSQSPYGCGVVFELSPPTLRGGAWTYMNLHMFCSVSACQDGAVSYAPLALDSAGNIYGTAEQGGTQNSGVVYELLPSSGGWSETVLYSFCSQGNGYICPDGAGPQTGVSFDNSGNMYGDTVTGGSAQERGGGVLYKLSFVSGAWTEAVIRAFNAPKGGYGPSGPVTIDSQGNLYIALFFGGYVNGASGKGVIKRLDFNGSTREFVFDGANGEGPSGVQLGTRRPLAYGITSFPLKSYNGNVYQISVTGKETILHTFCESPGCLDGQYPQGGLYEDSDGNLYGTASSGGTHGLGVAFEITP